MSLRDQVAVALRRLASGEPATHSSDGSSDITWRFVESMEESGLKHIKWPSTERDMKDVKSRFEKFYGLPNCCGVIDVTHFELCLASTSAEQSLDVWLDHNNKYSMVMQAIIGPDTKFMDIVVGWPGSMTESLVLEHSKFKELCDTGDRLMGNQLKLSKGLEISEYIIGDSGYPLLPYLVVPYEGNEDDLTDAKATFNRVHHATSWVATSALSRLKETWRFINGIVQESNTNRLPRIIQVCCILHNIVIDMEEDEDDERVVLYSGHDKGYNQLICGAMNDKGITLRENLTRYLTGA